MKTFTVKDTAKILNVSPEEVDYLAHTGKLEMVALDMPTGTAGFICSIFTSSDYFKYPYEITATSIMACQSPATQESTQDALHGAAPSVLNTKARNSLLTIVITLAVDAYRYNPTDDRSGVAREISESAAKLGLTIGERTIRDYLREASGLVDSDKW